MTTYRVTFEVKLPDTASNDEAEEFIRFNLGNTADMNLSNPLAETDLQSCAVFGVLVDQA